MKLSQEPAEGSDRHCNLDSNVVSCPGPLGAVAPKEKENNAYNTGTGHEIKVRYMITIELYYGTTCTGPVSSNT